MSSWLTIACCAAMLVVFGVWPDPPGHQGYPPTTVPRLLACLAALSAIAAVVAQRRAPRPAVVPVLVLSWISFGALALSGGVVFELLAALHIVPSRSDGPTTALRALAIIAAATMLHCTLGCRTSRHRAASTPDRRWSWWGYAACALAFPYLLLKAYWSLGGTHGFVQADALNRYFGGPWGALFAGWGTVIAAMVGAATALALVWPGGERLPRWPLLVIGWIGAVLLLSAGMSGVYGVIKTAVDPASATQGFVTGWVFPLVYGNFAAWGVALAATTSHHQHQR
ncbi:hypothetical protein [Lentzea guizhouensis]|uniref:hypothetical protein n=1 Tax=Lentzea guizhouensis TaxID=1586287 RepID=UPI0012B698C9|nr:hypothetical protein [Lentzea guizhouensis]